MVDNSVGSGEVSNKVLWQGLGFKEGAGTLGIKLNTVREDFKNVTSEEKLKELSLFSLSERKKSGVRCSFPVCNTYFGKESSELLSTFRQNGRNSAAMMSNSVQLPSICLVKISRQG